jgi:hypothetical protein
MARRRIYKIINMSATKEYRIIIDKVKKQLTKELDRIVHWELTDWDYDGEKYVKELVIKELYEKYTAK